MESIYPGKLGTVTQAIFVNLGTDDAQPGKVKFDKEDREIDAYGYNYDMYIAPGTTIIVQHVRSETCVVVAPFKEP